MSDDMMRYLKVRSPIQTVNLGFNPPPTGATGFRDSNGRRIHRGCICVVADTLANKREVVNAEQSGQSQVWLDRFAGAIDECRKELAGTSDLPDWRFSIFSDSIILAHIMDKTSTVGELEFSTIFDAITRLQCDMFRSGFFLRGGLAIGSLHMEDHIATGIALVRAASLPQNRMPSIYLDEVAGRLVRHCLGFYGSPAESPYGRTLLYDEASSCFVVNYLDGANYGEWGTDADMIEDHASRLSALKGCAGNDAEALRKVEWLCAYHNFFIDHCVWGTEEVDPGPRCRAVRLDAAAPCELRRIRDDDAEFMNA